MPLLTLSSSNTKTGPVAATYASIEVTCPPRCALKKVGSCYAQLGRVGLHGRRLDQADRELTPLGAARAEAALLDAVVTPLGRPIRLHVSGDCRTPAAARALAHAVRRWEGRVGGRAWSYTHAWRAVKRSDWGRVSVLGSIERPRDARKVMERGYAPALVVQTHPSKRAYRAHGVEWIPCPEQTVGVTCAQCRLCWNGDALRKREQGVAFAAHGPRRKRVLQVLNHRSHP